MKKYYWLKLKEDFFSSKRIKKLRKMAGGDTFIIIYLKLQLIAMKNEGIIEFDHLEQDIVDELALELDEEQDNIRATLIYLTSCGLAEVSDDSSLFFPYAIENTGSESDSAQRVRACRDRKKLLQCNTDVTTCNTDIDKDIDKDKRKSIKEKRFSKPSVDEVNEYISQQGYHIDAEEFVDFYESKGWVVGKNPMKDWKASVRTWERNWKQKNPQTKSIEEDYYGGNRYGFD